MGVEGRGDLGAEGADLVGGREAGVTGGQGIEGGGRDPRQRDDEREGQRQGKESAHLGQERKGFFLPFAPGATDLKMPA